MQFGQIALGVWRRLIKRPVRNVLIALLLVCGTAFAAIAMKQPRLDRDWVPHLAVMPVIETTETGFTLAPATDYAFNEHDPVSTGYVSVSEAFADLRDVWFMVEPQPGGDYAAHTLVMFEFANDHMIGLTIEARRHGQQKYSPLQGLFNNYELAYIWSTPRDLLTRRAVMLGKEIFVYPLQLTEQQKQDFLKALLAATTEVNTRPRFYNTLTSNCTNELAKVAGLSWHYSWVLTGYSPQHLFELGMIPGDTFEAAREQARLTRDIRGWNGLSSEDFSRELLKKLHHDAPIVQNGAADRTH
jgi:hypothetical protein